MKKQILLPLIAVISFNCFSQISYEKGYYIDNSNNKIDCLIKNIDWKSNPKAFKYKLSENSEPKNADIKSVKAFEIYNTLKYIRSTVKIDRSSEVISRMSNDRNPVFVEEQLFLKVLVEGKANLYFYEDGGLNRYFYNKENTNIEQLVFKSYKTPDNKIGKNNTFKMQLKNDFECPAIRMKNIENLEYKKNSLINIFISYNKCNNQDFINYEKKQKKDLFNLTLRPGLNSSSLAIQNINTSRNFDFSNELGLRLGIEAEFIMSFNKNK